MAGGIAGALFCLKITACTTRAQDCDSYQRCQSSGLGDESMLWTIFAILLILWLLGWGFHIAGSLIHLLLVVAVIVLIINLVTGRRTV
jgi:DMSO reductase anchor subunit